MKQLVLILALAFAATACECPNKRRPQPIAVQSIAVATGAVKAKKAHFDHSLPNTKGTQTVAYIDDEGRLNVVPCTSIDFIRGDGHIRTINSASDRIRDPANMRAIITQVIENCRARVPQVNIKQTAEPVQEEKRENTDTAVPSTYVRIGD